MPTALVIGASRGLGLELAKATSQDPRYATPSSKVFATVRSPSTSLPSSISTIPNVNLSHPDDAGKAIVEAVKKEGVSGLDLVIINAGIFVKETLDTPNFEAEVDMYKVVSIAPVFVAHHLRTSNLLSNPSTIVLITSEGGSIALRTPEEGGGNYGHHASKAAANMVGKLLANDLREGGVTVLMIHPGFMRTEMTKGVGYDQYWDSGGAVLPAEAAASTLDFINTRTPDLTLSGTFWAPRGPRDIGEAERVLGKDLPTPLQLPW